MKIIATSPDGSGNPFWITRSAAKGNLQCSAAELQKDCNGKLEIASNKLHYTRLDSSFLAMTK